MRSFIKVLRQNPVQQKLSTNEQVNSWSKMVLLLSILSEFWFRLFKMCMVLINLPTKNDQELSKFMVFSRIQTDLYTGFHYYKTGRLLDHYMADSPGDIWKCVSAALDASTSHTIIPYKVINLISCTKYGIVTGLLTDQCPLIGIILLQHWAHSTNHCSSDQLVTTD